MTKAEVLKTLQAHMDDIKVHPIIQSLQLKIFLRSYFLLLPNWGRVVCGLLCCKVRDQQAKSLIPN